MKNKCCYAIMAFSFLLKVGKVLAFLQSLGSELQIFYSFLFHQISTRFLFLSFSQLSLDRFSVMNPMVKCEFHLIILLYICALQTLRKMNLAKSLDQFSSPSTNDHG